MSALLASKNQLGEEKLPRQSLWEEKLSGHVYVVVVASESSVVANDLLFCCVKLSFALTPSCECDTSDIAVALVLVNSGSGIALLLYV